jgi:hypothetical protein
MPETSNRSFLIIILILTGLAIAFSVYVLQISISPIDMQLTQLLPHCWLSGPVSSSDGELE